MLLFFLFVYGLALFLINWMHCSVGNLGQSVESHSCTHISTWAKEHGHWDGDDQDGTSVYGWHKENTRWVINTGEIGLNHATVHGVNQSRIGVRVILNKGVRILYESINVINVIVKRGLSGLMLSRLLIDWCWWPTPLLIFSTEPVSQFKSIALLIRACLLVVCGGIVE